MCSICGETDHPTPDLPPALTMAMADANNLREKEVDAKIRLSCVEFATTIKGEQIVLSDGSTKHASTRDVIATAHALYNFVTKGMTDDNRT